MIKLEAHVFAGTFLKPITLEVEEWLKNQPDSIKRRTIGNMVAEYLNKYAYKGRRDWVHQDNFCSGETNVHYSSLHKANEFNFITCKILKS